MKSKIKHVCTLCQLEAIDREYYYWATAEQQSGKNQWNENMGNSKAHNELLYTHILVLLIYYIIIEQKSDNLIMWF